MKYHKLINFVFCSLFLILFSTYAPASSEKFPDKLALLKLLQDKKFKKLDSTFMSYQKKYESKVDNEKHVNFVFSSFSNVDPANERLLSDWIKKIPNSYAANLSRGIYYYSVAFANRGTLFINETKDKQINKMQDYMGKSEKDLIKATQLSSRPTLAYSYLIQVSSTSGTKSSITKYLNKGLAINPASYYVRKAYLGSLEPKWGGSLKQMATFLKDTRKYILDNPRLNTLLGYLDYTKADIFKLNKNRVKAEIYYNKAITYGDNSFYYYKRAINFYMLKNYNAALIDINRALKVWPQYTSALLWRAKIYKKKKMYNEALADLDLALKLDPYDSKILKTRGYLFSKLKKIHKANEDFIKSTYYNPFNAGVWYSIAWNYHYKMNNYVKAAEAFKKTIILKPKNIKYWYAYSITLNVLQDCEIVGSLEKYLDLCDINSNKKCGGDRTTWAKNTLTTLEQRKLCP